MLVTGSQHSANPNPVPWNMVSKLQNHLLDLHAGILSTGRPISKVYTLKPGTEHPFFSTIRNALCYWLGECILNSISARVDQPKWRTLHMRPKSNTNWVPLRCHWASYYADRYSPCLHITDCNIKTHNKLDLFCITMQMPSNPGRYQFNLPWGETT